MPRRLWLLVFVLLLAGLLAGLWQWLASTGALSPQALHAAADRAAALSDASWIPVILLALYVLGSLVVFPLSILVAATGLLYGPTWGCVYAFAGTLLGATVTYLAGWAVGRETLQRYAGRSLGGVVAMVTRRGLTTMILISLLPIAPFTLTNMAAGAFDIRFRDYLLGTVIGITPGLVAMTVIGSQLSTLLQAGSLDTALWALLAILACIGAIAAGRHFAARRERMLLEAKIEMSESVQAASSDRAQRDGDFSATRYDDSRPARSRRRE